MADAECIPSIKSCTGCLEDKPMAAFYPAATGKHGRRAKCRVCEEKIKNQWEQKNQELVRGYWAKSKRLLRQTAEGKASMKLARQKYRVNNLEKINAYQRLRRQLDPAARIAAVMRASLQRILTQANKRKDAKCEVIHGYTRLDLVRHIEKQFTKGMCWELVGPQIEIDHIIPVAEFFRIGETRPSVINALSNLRPIWSEHNREKSDKVLYLL